MTNELFERLLYEEEGTTIDFKKEQYRFVKAKHGASFCVALFQLANGRFRQGPDQIRPSGTEPHP